MRAGELWPSAPSTAKAEALCPMPSQGHSSQPHQFLLITALAARLSWNTSVFCPPCAEHTGQVSLQWLWQDSERRARFTLSVNEPQVSPSWGTAETSSSKHWGCHGCPGSCQRPQQEITNELPHQKMNRSQHLPMHAPQCGTTRPQCPQLPQLLGRALHSLLRSRDSPQPQHSLSRADNSES